VKIDRMAGQIDFDSYEDFLDSLISLSIRVSEYGDETSNPDITFQEEINLKGRRLLWQGGLSLQRKLRRELLQALPQNKISLRT